jgi:hypothetical protein
MESDKHIYWKLPIIVDLVNIYFNKRVVERLKPVSTEPNKLKQNFQTSNPLNLKISIGEPKYRKIMKSVDKESSETKESFVGNDCVITSITVGKAHGSVEAKISAQKRSFSK